MSHKEKKIRKITRKSSFKTFEDGQSLQSLYLEQEVDLQSDESFSEDKLLLMKLSENDMKLIELDILEENIKKLMGEKIKKKRDKDKVG